MKVKNSWYWVISICFLLLINAAYINFAFHATPGYRYTGANPYAAADKLVYMSMIEQGRQGILFMKNLHTTDPQRGLLLSPHWYLIGQTGKFLHISNNSSYQLYRVLFAAGFVILLYGILRKLFPQPPDLLGAAAFIFFSGGLGWLYIVQNPPVLSLVSTLQKYLYLPTDMYVTEGNTLLNFSQSPSFIISQFLLVVCMYLFVRYRDDSSFRWDIVNAALFAVLVIIHPYDLPILLAVLGSWALWYAYQTKSMKSLYKLGILSAGGIVAYLYTVYSLWADPVLAGWYAQNLVYSPPLRNYLWGYGMLVPLWLIGSAVLYRTKRHDPWWVLFLIWSWIILLLLYLPLTINRRFINGYHIALALVAFVGFRFILDQTRRWWLKTATVGALSIVLFGSLGFYVLVNFRFAPSIYTYGYYYISDEEQRMLDFLASQTTAHDALMTSDMKTSFTITSQVNRAVFRGHDHQTPLVLEKQQQMDWFFGANEGVRALERKKEFLEDQKIRYIVINTTRLDQPVTWLGAADFVSEVYRSDDFIIYRVQA